MINMAIKSLIHYKKRTSASLLVIFTVVFLSVFVNTITLSLEHESEDRIKREFGYWQYVSKTSLGPNVTLVGESKQMGEVNTIFGDYGFSIFDAEMFELASLRLIEGRLPENEQEFIVDFNTITSLGYDYSINQEFGFEIENQRYEGVLVGIYASINGRWEPNDISTTYPNIISTGNFEAGDVLYYSISDTTPHESVHVGINLTSYPLLNPNLTEADHQYHQAEVLRISHQNKTLNTALIILGLFIILNLFILNAHKITLHVSKMKLMGITNFNVVLYLLTTALVYALFAYIFVNISKILSHLLLLPFIKSDLIALNPMLFRDVMKYNCVGIPLIYLGVNMRSLFTRFIASTIIHSRRQVFSNKIFKQAGYIVLISLVMFFSFEGVLKIATKSFPEYQSRYRNMIEHNHYSLNIFPNNVTQGEPIRGILELDLSVPCSQTKIFECGLTDSDLDAVSNIDDILDVKALSYLYVRPMIDENGRDLVIYEIPEDIEESNFFIKTLGTAGIRMYIFNDRNAEYIAKYYDTTLTTDFFKGNQGLLYIPNDKTYQDEMVARTHDNLSQLQTGSKVKLGSNGIILSIHMISQLDFDLRQIDYYPPIMTNTTNQISLFVHESFAKKLGIEHYKYQEVIVKPIPNANYKETDRIISRFASYDHLHILNHRMSLEITLIPYRTALISDLVQFVLFFILGINLLSSFIVSDIASMRKSIGLRRLMGEEKTKILSRFMSQRLINVFIAFHFTLWFAIHYSISNHKHYYSIDNGKLYNNHPLGLEFMPLKEYITNYMRFNTSLKYILIIVGLYVLVMGLVSLVTFKFIFKENPLRNLEEREP